MNKRKSTNSYLSAGNIISSASVYENYSDDLAFFTDVVSIFEQIIEKFPKGFLPGTVSLPLSFDTQAKNTEEIELSLEGTLVFIYVKMFDEPYPSLPYTYLQIQRINAIWEGIGHPENIIAI